MAKTIKDRLKQDDKVMLTRCFKTKDKYFELGEYAVKDLPNSVFELGLAIAKPSQPSAEKEPAATSKTTEKSSSKK